MSTPTGTGTEPLLDLPRLAVAIRRRRRLWLAAGLVGLLAGLALAIVLPTPPTAVAQLLIVHEDDQATDDGNLMETDVALVHTTRIAAAALERIGSGEPPEEFVETYEAAGLTNNVMELRVEGTTEADALRRAEVLSTTFIADHVRRVEQAAAAEAKAFVTQRQQMQQELDEVNAAINQGGAGVDADGDGVPDATTEGAEDAEGSATAESRYARRAELTAKISDLTTRAEEAGIGSPRVGAGTQIVSAPRIDEQSLLLTAGTYAAIGCGLALVFGIMFAAVTGVVRDKPVLRRDIAEHLGASVVAQLPAPLPPRVLGRRLPHRPRRDAFAVRERERVAATVARLVRVPAPARGHRPPGSLSLLEIGAAPVAAALTLDIAVRLAEHRSVAIVEDRAGRLVADDPQGRTVEDLVAAHHRPIRVASIGDYSAADVRLGIGSATPGTAWTDLRYLGAETVLVVRSGFANTTWLHTVARQLADCGIPIVGVVLVDPDPRDDSDGTLWDGLRTALRGRAMARTANGGNGHPPSPAGLITVPRTLAPGRER